MGNFVHINRISYYPTLLLSTSKPDLFCQKNGVFLAKSPLLYS